MTDDAFHGGDVAEAIKLSNASKKPLVVFLKSDSEASNAVEAALLTPEAQSVLKQCITLRLMDDLEDTEQEEYSNARKFRHFFPIDQIPAIFLLGANGTSIVLLKGSIDPQDLLSELQNGIQIYKTRLTPSATETAPETRSAERERSAASTSVDRTAESVTATHLPRGRESQIVDKKKKKPVMETKPKPPPVYRHAVIRVRLTNDEFIQNEFHADATLRELCSYVDIHRTDGGNPYVLETMYPRQVLGKELFGKTLRELDLVPRSTVHLTPLTAAVGAARESVSHATAEAPTGITSTLYSAISSVVGYVGSWSFFSTGGNEPHDSGSAENTFEQQQQSSESIPQSDKTRSGVRQRAPGGGSVHGLYDDRPSAEHRPSDNSFWNGNSVEYRDDGDDKHED